ncbi:hypothetical protein FGG08_000239 [Glutinoglossum americanum]|uniref:Uncharacterized protein n=1 Tax=Glutinoglossum americanum TaxID=1670608 RepID=A0A9P8ID74_9PEZI|nr:hypothetical protein FGG08_000239 [Glutinoglossum americanum]
MESRILPAPRPFEFAGPGTLVSQTIIDLTGDDSPPPSHATSRDHSSSRISRPPRYPRDIIDVDALPDTPERRSAALRPHSPEVELTFSRPRVPTRVDLHRPTGLRTVAQPVEPHQIYSSAPRGVNHGVAGVNERGPAAATAQSQAHLNLHERLSLISQQFNTEINSFDDERDPPRRARQQNNNGGHFPVAANFPIPMLDYRDVGFELMPEDLPDDAVIVLGKRNYSAPEPAQEGFTRSPNEEDVIVCPNCDDELTVGDGEVKRSVWVAKCGHVYCGECTKGRKVTSKKKSPKSKNPPFAVCRVDGCNQKVSAPTAMFQLYL